MRKITYFKKVFKNIEQEQLEYIQQVMSEKDTHNYIPEKFEPTYVIEKDVYYTEDDEYKNWLDIITKTYGDYGPIKSEYVEDTVELNQRELNAFLLKQIGEISRHVSDQNKFNSNVMVELAKLKLGGK